MSWREPIYLSQPHQEQILQVLPLEKKGARGKLCKLSDLNDNLSILGALYHSWKLTKILCINVDPEPDRLVSGSIPRKNTCTDQMPAQVFLWGGLFFGVESIFQVVVTIFGYCSTYCFRIKYPVRINRYLSQSTSVWWRNNWFGFEPGTHLFKCGRGQRLFGLSPPFFFLSYGDRPKLVWWSCINT